MKSVIFLLSLVLVGCKDRTCTLKKEAWPEIRGVKLGMKYDQVLANYPKLPALQQDRYGVSEIIFESGLELGEASEPNSVAYSYRDSGSIFGSTVRALVISADSYPQLKDVRQLHVAFVDGQVAKVLVFYQNELNWTSIDAFASQSIVKLGLPADASWKMSSDKQSQYLTCTNFTEKSVDSLSVDLGFKKLSYLSADTFPYIEIKDFTADMKTFGRKQDEEKAEKQRQEEKQKQFQP